MADPTIQEEELLADPQISQPPQLHTNSDTIDEELLGVFLYTEFQKKLEEVRDVVQKGPLQEEKPFDHFYEARKILQSLFESLKGYLKIEGPNSILLKSVKDVSSIGNSNFLDLSIGKEEKKEEELDALPTWAEELPIAGKLSLAIVFYNLGQNHSDSEEYTEALQYLIRSLELMNSLTNEVKFQQLNLIQKLYNTLGIIHCNKQIPAKGLPYFLKAEFVYQLAKDSAKQGNLTNNFKVFLTQKTNQGNKENESLNSDLPEDSKMDFSFYIDGGLNFKELEHNYTMSAFFLTQAYTHTHQKDKAITYCALTMKRQLESGDFELREWAHNAMQLADYFLDREQFAQAEYCLFAGLSLIPSANMNQSAVTNEAEESKHNVTSTSVGIGTVGFPEEIDKLKADFDMQLGRYYLVRLKFAVHHFGKNLEQVDPQLFSKLQQQYVSFEKILPLKWPKIESVTTIEQATALFRLANTRFKNSLKYYVLDGFVTEHIELTRHVSELYEQLSGLETDTRRIYAMQERRLGLLEPIASVLNKKVYENYFIYLKNDIADVTANMFELQLLEFENQKKAKKKKSIKPASIDALNQMGEKSVKSSEEIIELYHFILEREGAEKGVTADLKKEYAQSLINLHFKAARICTKLLNLEGKWDIFVWQKKGLAHYEAIVEFVESFKNEDKRLLDKAIWDQYTQCKEMCELLPIKLAKMKAAESSGARLSI